MEGAFLTTTASHRRCTWPQHKLNDRRNVNSNTACFSDSLATNPRRLPRAGFRARTHGNVMRVTPNTGASLQLRSAVTSRRAWALVGMTSMSLLYFTFYAGVHCSEACTRHHASAAATMFRRCASISLSAFRAPQSCVSVVVRAASSECAASVQGAARLPAVCVSAVAQPLS